MHTQTIGGNAGWGGGRGAKGYLLTKADNSSSGQTIRGYVSSQAVAIG